MKQDKRGAAVVGYVQFLFSVGAVSLFILGHIFQNNDLLLIALSVLFIGNVLYGVRQFRERILFTLFNCACMFFLFGRNVVELLSGENWQFRFSNSVNCMAVSLIFLSLLFLLIGSYIADRITVLSGSRPQTVRYEKSDGEYLNLIRLVSFLLYWFCAVFLLMYEIDKLIFMQGKEYYQYYAEFESRLPGFFASIGALAKFCLCLFLATKPSKKIAFFPLAAYLISTLPMFIIGQRNSFISAALLILCYYILRDYSDRRDGVLKNAWLGKTEISIILVALPFLLAFLSMYESIRYGKTASSVGIFESILKLLRSQGVTYNVIGRGLDKADVLGGNTNYTFGPFIVYFTSNALSVKLFGTSVIKAQTIESALSGYNFADSISYLYLGNSFVDGAGLGSSYIMECYLDFGLIGLLVYSVVLGFLLVYAAKVFNKSVAGTFATMLCLISIFMVPRASALRFAVLLVYIPMFLLLIAILLLAALLIKKYFQK